jgi:hypothetical protein
MTDVFWQDFRKILPFVRVLNFTGGEPFMMNAYWDMIDMAVQTGAAEHMELHLSSNVSAIKWDRGNIMDCFAAFQRVRLQASIDSFLVYNDYIRYPSDYDTLIENIQRIRDERPDTEIVVSSVVSALSVRMMAALNLHVEGVLGFTHSFTNVLNSPDYQKVEYLPDSVKVLYLDWGGFRGEKWTDIVKLLMKPEDLDKHEMLLNRCRALDKHRGTNAPGLWPEFNW